MAETARMAVFHGAGKPFEIREYPVPDPEPGAILVKVAMANVCGSDLHYWRGELDYVKMGRPLPLRALRNARRFIAALPQLLQRGFQEDSDLRIPGPGSSAETPQQQVDLHRDDEDQRLDLLRP